MKKVSVSGRIEFAASATDKARAMAHARAIARRAMHDGKVAVYLDRDTGVFHILELVGLDYIVPGDGIEYIGAAPCYA